MQASKKLKAAYTRRSEPDRGTVGKAPANIASRFVRGIVPPRQSGKASGQAQSVNAAATAPVRAGRRCASTAKTWRGVPAAAQMVVNSSSRGSIHARIGLR